MASKYYSYGWKCVMFIWIYEALTYVDDEGNSFPGYAVGYDSGPQF